MRNNIRKERLERSIKTIDDSYKNGTSALDKFGEQVAGTRAYADLHKDAFRSFGFKKD